MDGAFIIIFLFCLTRYPENHIRNGVIHSGYIKFNNKVTIIIQEMMNVLILVKLKFWYGQSK